MNLFKESEAQENGFSIELSRAIEALKYNEDGLIPAIAQDHQTKNVLMMAWMNATSLKETLETGQVCYWSRSRQTYWRKGESSGHRQQLISMRFDCDGDAILMQVKQLGPACHTNRKSCFYWQVNEQTIRIQNTDSD